MSSAFAFPQGGRSKRELIDQLGRFRSSGADWRGGRVPLFVFHADDAVEDVSREAFNMFFSENAQAAAAFPAIEQMAGEVTRAALGLLSAPDGADGLFTSGGTESIFLAVLCARESARACGRGNPARHNIVIPRTGHPAFDKAARYLDLTVRRTAIGGDFRADLSAMQAAADVDTMLVVGSAPGFPHGVFDPLEEIAEFAARTGIWMHVDACVGGYLAPFVSRLGYPVPDFDFRLPGVRSISADLHKYAYTAKPASTILFRSGEDARLCEFVFSDWPRGSYRSRTFSGSRPAGAVASAWAVLNFLGAEGYLRHARTVMRTRDRLIEGIDSIGPLQVQGAPELGLFSYASGELDIHLVGDGLEDRGWFVARNAEPPSLQFLAMPVHETIVDAYLADLADAAQAAMHAGEAARPRNATVIY